MQGPPGQREPVWEGPRAAELLDLGAASTAPGRPFLEVEKASFSSSCGSGRASVPGAALPALMGGGGARPALPRGPQARHLLTHRPGSPPRPTRLAACPASPIPSLPPPSASLAGREVWGAGVGEGPWKCGKVPGCREEPDLSQGSRVVPSPPCAAGPGSGVGVMTWPPLAGD